MAMERILTRSLRLTFVSQVRRRATVPTDDFDPRQAKTEAEFAEDVVELPPERLRKGGLTEAHRRVVMGQKPYDESMEFYHDTVKYKRKLLGRYGMEAAGVPAGVAWPTLEEVQLQQEYERVSHRWTLQEQWAYYVERDKKMKKKIEEREAELDANMAKVEMWKQQLNDKIQKKEQEQEAAIMKKQKVMDEIRRHFGYNISTKDERFQKMLMEKEAQDKKQRKEDRKKVREERKLKSLRLMEEAAQQTAAKTQGQQNPTKEKQKSELSGDREED